MVLWLEVTGINLNCRWGNLLPTIRSHKLYIWFWLWQQYFWQTLLLTIQGQQRGCLTFHNYSMLVKYVAVNVGSYHCWWVKKKCQRLIVISLSCDLAKLHLMKFGIWRVNILPVSYKQYVVCGNPHRVTKWLIRSKQYTHCQISFDSLFYWSA